MFSMSFFSGKYSKMVATICHFHLANSSHSVSLKSWFFFLKHQPRGHFITHFGGDQTKQMYGKLEDFFQLITVHCLGWSCNDYVVATQIFFIFTPIWGRFPFWRAYFSNGLVQPPTRWPLQPVLNSVGPFVICVRHCTPNVIRSSDSSWIFFWWILQQVTWSNSSLSLDLTWGLYYQVISIYII